MEKNHECADTKECKLCTFITLIYAEVLYELDLIHSPEYIKAWNAARNGNKIKTTVPFLTWKPDATYKERLESIVFYNNLDINSINYIIKILKKILIIPISDVNLYDAYFTSNIEYNILFSKYFMKHYNIDPLDPIVEAECPTIYVKYKLCICNNKYCKLHNLMTFSQFERVHKYSSFQCGGKITTKMPFLHWDVDSIYYERLESICYYNPYIKFDVIYKGALLWIELGKEYDLNIDMAHAIDAVLMGGFATFIKYILDDANNYDFSLIMSECIIYYYDNYYYT